MLTAGGLAPCLSSAVGGLIERYTRGRAGRADHRLSQRLRGPAHRPIRRGDRRGAGPCVSSARVRWQPDRQQPGEAHQRRRLRQTRPGEARAGPAARRRRAIEPRRRPGPPHDRRRRHQRHRRRPRRLPAQQRLRAHGGRPAKDDRQRCGADQADARRVDRRRAGRLVRPQHHRRAFVKPADADRARGDGAQLRLADRGHRARAPSVGTAC